MLTWFWYAHFSELILLVYDIMRSLNLHFGISPLEHMFIDILILLLISTFPPFLCAGFSFTYMYISYMAIHSFVIFLHFWSAVGIQ